MSDSEEYLKKQIRMESQQQKQSVAGQKAAIASGMYPPSFFMPLSLQFELTGRCNMKCRHCYNRSGDLPPDVMTSDRWKELSKELVEHGGIFECILSGGEPLILGNDLFDIMDILHDDGSVFLLITNAALMAKDTVQKLKKYRYKWIQISIDGSTVEAHDGFRQVSGSWEKAVNAALMVADAGIPLAIANTVTPETIRDLPEMAELAYFCGAALLITGEVFPSGRGALNDKLLLNNEQRAMFWRLIEKQRDIFAGRMQIQRSMSNRAQLEGAADLPAAGAIIRPNGDIRLDCIAPFVMGNVTNALFYDQWQKGRNGWQDQRVKDYIESVDPYSGKSILHQNHVEGDIVL
ncbi:MAG: radical SAM protein [Treponema sp.]|nr:radical SAM protein [Treponema sp.]